MNGAMTLSHVEAVERKIVIVSEAPVCLQQKMLSDGSVGKLIERIPAWKQVRKRGGHYTGTVCKLVGYILLMSDLNAFGLLSSETMSLCLHGAEHLTPHASG
jgi:hypothetical protein